MGFVPGQSVERVVAFSRSKGHQRFGALVPKNVYGNRSAAAFRAAVAEAGGPLVAVESYDRSATALSGAARRLANQGALAAVLIGERGRRSEDRREETDRVMPGRYRWVPDN